jgi:hypothetical protein
MQKFKSTDVVRPDGVPADVWAVVCRSAAVHRRAGQRKSTAVRTIQHGGWALATAQAAVNAVYALGDCPVCED